MHHGTSKFGVARSCHIRPLAYILRPYHQRHPVPIWYIPHCKVGGRQEHPLSSGQPETGENLYLSF